MGPFFMKHSKVRGAYCLGVFQNGKDPTTLLGGIIVRNTLVMYDREQEKIGFWKTNCAELWERLQESIAPSLPPNSEASYPTEALEPSVAPSLSQNNSPPGELKIAQITMLISFNISYVDMKPHITELAGLFAHGLDINTSQVHLLNFTSTGNDSLSKWVITPKPYAHYISNTTATNIISRLAEHRIQLPDSFGNYKLIDWSVEPPSKNWWQQYFWVVGLAILVALLVGLSILGTFLIWRKRQQNLHSYKPVDASVPEQELQPL
ncbi:unnamed protein product [Sphenostylis stenocarpa]|uniref:Peptidase A1 domain-containing protein n=1 Tax=Sphenostylis stenocarpa TaxID=92480 RepID=A0AA86VZQ0_9FABA|nr:unnamed protein product [Sphenostylis stenocarpa]